MLTAEQQSLCFIPDPDEVYALCAVLSTGSVDVNVRCIPKSTLIAVRADIDEEKNRMCTVSYLT